MRKNILTRRKDISQNMFNGNKSNRGFDNENLFDPFGDFLLKNDSVGHNNESSENDWMGREFEGQLSVDVYETADSIVIKSAIAGVRPEDLEIFFENEMLTIRGYRHLNEDVKEDNYFYKECYWGGFSRSIILPVDVDTDDMNAILDNGVLTIVVGKRFDGKKIRIPIVENNS